MSALLKIRQAGFDVSLTEAGGLAIVPASQLTQSWREFLKSHKAEIIDDLKTEPMTVSAQDKQKILAWFAHIGETDQIDIAQTLELCGADPDALAYYLKRSEDVIND
jgi:beta-phosphoglucomutase-like phosphatase (HAD superfamily)